MSDADWIDKALAEWKYEVADDIRRDIAIELRQAHAAHFATGDTDKLAERIAKAVILESVRYLHRDMEDHHQECEVRDWYEAKSATYQGVIYAMLAPILARNAAMEAVLRECRRFVKYVGSVTESDDLEADVGSLLSRIDQLTAKGATAT